MPIVTNGGSTRPPGRRCARTRRQGARVEEVLQRLLLVALDGDPGHAGFAARQPRGEGRDLTGDSRAHEHVVDACQDRAEHRGGGGELDLLQVVDADEAIVSLLGQPDLDEVAEDGEYVRRGPAGHA
ncbi:hypothetical protein [Streptomyces sp. H27-H5]|uniref:hypothetical protein n=1 Tax=Streptomyces sp. H27-H5 TaxID=2996460 RepID=UPI00226F4089|nr:hypothetical protein [Streptomyces sp. H27-H5]MCY0957545.1 hypothetical protein [Streptomyces sp. H27-H5]